MLHSVCEAECSRGVKTMVADLRKIQYATVTVIKSFQLVLIHLNSLLVMIVCYRNCKLFHALRDFFFSTLTGRNRILSLL